MKMPFAVIPLVLAILAPMGATAAPEDALYACEPYRGEVEDILQAEGVSPTYYYLMVAESRCRPRSVSTQGARGLWQLMPATARAYGCDSPDDLRCATSAAARYILHLQETYRRFDDIIMAYNMGGRNYRKYGASREALGLVRAVHILMEADK